MYCPNCSEYIINIGNFDDDYTSATTESDSWSFDEDSMLTEDDEYMPDFRSGLKRSRAEAGLKRNLPNERPIKRVCREQDLDRTDAPTRMDVDNDDYMESLVNRMANITLQ